MAGVQTLQHPGHRFGFVVLVHGQPVAAGVINAIGAQQGLAVARVFAGHAVHQTQQVQGAQTDVGKITNRCGHHIQRALRIMLRRGGRMGCCPR